jgi:ribulose-phosphate 3-epimerase
MQIFPSLISQNLDELQSHIRLLGPHCAGFHVDIMDGMFVNQKMGSAQLTNQITRMTRKQLWIHIMAKDPLAIIKDLKPHKGDIVSFHATANYDYQEIIEELEKKNVLPSLALSPSTPITVLNNAIHAIDHVTIMSVEPGKAGQAFLPSTLNKLERINAFRAAHECRLTIAVDGGVNAKNISKIDNLGVNQIAVTSGIFNSDDPLESLKELTKISSF